MGKTSDKYLSLCIYLTLALVTLAVFWQVYNYEFVNLDDLSFVAENPHVKAGLTRDSLRWAFAIGGHHKDYWHPVTWLSYMLDCELFGVNPGWHHFVNLLLHITNTLLLFGLLKLMTGCIWRSAFVAALFALHPLNVEAVAWISERKTVLSTMFGMLTMLAYVRYVKRPATSLYLLTLVTYALGLMSKPILVTLPFVLLLLDYWPLGRFRFSQVAQDSETAKCKSAYIRSRWRVIYGLVWEKARLFGLAAISVFISSLSVPSREGAMATGWVPMTLRIANALVSYVKCIAKMFWPRNLAVFYPYPKSVPLVQTIGALLLLVCVSVLLIRLARSRPYLGTGWLWYLGTLVPVIGLIQAGLWPAMADRFGYVSLIGLFIIIAWVIPDLLAKWQYRKIVLGASVVIVLLPLSVCTHLQLRHWRNNTALFERALNVTKDNFLAYCSLASSLQKQGEIDKAIDYYSRAIRIKPNYATSHLGIGTALLKTGRLDEAIEHFRESIRINPNYADRHYNLGLALLRKGNVDDAIESWQQAVQLDPNHYKAYVRLGEAFYRLGKLDQAIEHFSQALRLNPRDAAVHRNLKDALARRSRDNKTVR